MSGYELKAGVTVSPCLLWGSSWCSRVRIPPCSTPAVSKPGTMGTPSIVSRARPCAGGATLPLWININVLTADWLVQLLQLLSGQFFALVWAPWLAGEVNATANKEQHLFSIPPHTHTYISTFKTWVVVPLPILAASIRYNLCHLWDTASLCGL